LLGKHRLILGKEIRCNGACGRLRNAKEEAARGFADKPDFDGKTSGMGRLRRILQDRFFDRLYEKHLFEYLFGTFGQGPFEGAISH
jgi:hypothetical protein